jgi:hypothetical protein
MYCNFNYYIIQFIFLKFVVHEINSEMIKSEMKVLTERKKTDADRL